MNEEISMSEEEMLLKKLDEQYAARCDDENSSSMRKEKTKVVSKTTRDEDEASMGDIDFYFKYGKKKPMLKEGEDREAKLKRKRNI